MPEFLYRIQPTRPQMLTEGLTEHESEVIGAHFDYLSGLVDQGRVLMAGPTLNKDRRCFGIVVFVAPTWEDAEALMRADPAVERGVMHAELFPFRVALWSQQGPPPKG